jgi:hypothetical protein
MVLSLAQRSKQSLFLDDLPGNGGGSDVPAHMFGVGRPGDAMRVYAHASALDGTPGTDLI